MSTKYCPHFRRIQHQDKYDSKNRPKFHVFKTTLIINELRTKYTPTPRKSKFWPNKTYGLDRPNVCF